MGHWDRHEKEGHDDHKNIRMMEDGAKWMPFSVAALYAILGVLWILFSDSFLRILFPHPASYQIGQTYKGFAFVMVSALTLVFLLHRYQKKVNTAHDELQKTNRALRAIQTSNQNLVRLSDEQEMLQQACKGVVDCAGYVMSWVGFRDQVGKDRIVPLAYHSQLEKRPSHIPRSPIDDRDEYPPLFEALSSGEPQIYDDLTAHAMNASWQQRVLDDGFQSLIVLPIKVQEKCRGVLTIYDDTPNAFGNDEKQLLKEMAADLSFGIETVRNQKQITKAREALAERERELSTLLSNLPGMAYRCRHDQQWTMEFVSEGASSLTGYDPEDLVNNETIAYNALIHPDDQKVVRDAIDKALAEKEPFEITYRIQSARGAEKWVWERGRGIFKDDGDLAAIEGFITDITERKHAKEKLQKALSDLRQTQEQLIEQERRRALTTMASGIAHNFNNALATIKGFADLLLENPDQMEDKQKVHHYLDRIRSASEKAAKTVRRLRIFYRPQSQNELRSVDVNTVVRDAVSVTRSRWQYEAQAEGKNIDVNTELSDIPNIMGNEAELHELLSSLIFNAVEAIEEDGHIEISTEFNSNEVMLTVKDDGVGMDEDMQKNCMDPFFTSKAGPGKGLGMSTSRGIVNRHSGDIRIESEPGVGTTIRITFPAHNKDVPEESCGPEETSVSDLHVLIVEDDPSQQNLIKDILEESGHTVTLADNGEQGLELFQQGKFDVVITDRAMPQIAGDELAEKIQKTDPQQPLIMLTGFGDVMESAAEKPDGVDVVLPKPATQRELTKALEEAV